MYDMARPNKAGLEYFSLDCGMDDKVELIEAKYGLIGFAVIIKLWQKIYSEGYYYKRNMDTTEKGVKVNEQVRIFVLLRRL